jgi:anti-sigma regulatory factor (Ser/Thr protein kinase)
MQVCGTGTDPSWVEVAARLLGGSVVDCATLTSAPRGDGADGDCVRLLGAPTEKTLADALAGTAAICYILDKDFDIGALRKPHRILAPANRALGLCLSARTAYELPIGSVAASALAGNLAMPGSTQLNIDIALNEAIANALLHGCLDLQTPEDRFDPAFIDAIERRIADPVFASRPIWVAAHKSGDGLTVSVADEGKGFTPPAAPDLENPEKASRGTGLIHAAADHVEYRDHGRCLEMKFSL